MGMQAVAASPILLTGLATMALAIVLLMRSRRGVRIPFAATCVIVAVVQFATYGILVMSESGVEDVYLKSLSFLTPYITAFLLIMVLYVVDDERYLTSGWFAAILAFPTLSAVVVLTNPIHGLFGTMVDGVFVSGPWRTVIILMMTIMSIVSLLVLIRRFRYAGEYERHRLLNLMVGILAIIAINPLMMTLDDTFTKYTLAGIASTIVLYLIFWFMFSDEVVSVSPQTMRTLLDSMDDEAILLDAHNRIVSANGPAMHAIGANDPFGRSIFEVLDDERVSAIREAIDGGGERVVTIRGEGREYIIRVSSIRSRTGSDVGRILLFIDRTEEVRLRESLEEANGRLKMMSTIMRHDFANQLMALDHYTGKLMDSPSERDVIDISNKMVRIVQSMGGQLDFSRTYQMMGLEKPVWVDVSSTVKEMATELGVGDMIAIDDLDGLEVYADMMFKRAFFNLMDNSLRHGGHVSSIHVSSSRSGSNAVIVYEDDGEGIPRGSKDDVFELGHGSNTGLGLYMVREILSITGMRIMENGVDGARFVIVVPVGRWRETTRREARRP